jgi:DnaJ-class molecular chaperone
MRNFYQVLGTTSRADDSQLKRAFRNLAKTFHPDLNAGDKRSEERFKELNQAYDVLRDPEARAAYDAFLTDKQTRVRHRFRSAALTMSAAFALSTAVCFPLMVWLLGAKFSSSTIMC